MGRLLAIMSVPLATAWVVLWAAKSSVTALEPNLDRSSRWCLRSK